MKTVLMFACIEVMTLIQDIILYQIILVTEHIRSRGVPDGQYVLVVSGQKDGKYFETTSGTITVFGGNATMDVKLPVANPANPQQ